MPNTSATPPIRAPHIPVRQDWVDLLRETILEPELPIVDAHHHLWDRPTHRYLFDDYLNDIRSGHNIQATIYIQCRSMLRADGIEAMRPVGETEFANGMAAQSASGQYGSPRICAGIVGYADLLLGDGIAPVLEAHIRAAPDRFRGIRAMSAFDSSRDIAPGFGKVPPGVLMDRRFRQGFAHLAPLGLSYDVWAFHTQLDEVLDLAQNFPNTSVIVNHAGGPLGIGPYQGKHDEVLAVWTHSLRKLAACPNVTLKLGGLAMHISGLQFHRHTMPPSSEQLADAWRPYVHTGIELFGADRCMFESNFPVDKGMTGYRVLWNAFKRLTHNASADDKAALFSGTATRVYRLEPVKA